jgi:hypothetical protein
MTGSAEIAVVTDLGSPTLQVIGVGFGRTGTNSLRDALERLGFTPIEKMGHCNAHPERFALWLEAARRKRAGEPIDWRPLFNGYRTTLEWPGLYFWRELVAAHPGAKVILTVRDPERWYDSVRATLFAIYQRRTASPVGRFLRGVLSWLDPMVGHRYRVHDETIWNGTFAGRFDDRERTIRLFEEHAREVRAKVPAGRLLIFDVKQGWEPLCAFLGVPVPTGEPFPHVNSAADWQRRPLRYYLTLAKAPLPALAMAVGGGLVGLTIEATRRRHDGASHRRKPLRGHAARRRAPCHAGAADRPLPWR